MLKTNWDITTEEQTFEEKLKIGIDEVEQAAMRHTYASLAQKFRPHDLQAVRSALEMHLTVYRGQPVNRTLLQEVSKNVDVLLANVNRPWIAYRLRVDEDNNVTAIPTNIPTGILFSGLMSQCQITPAMLEEIAIDKDIADDIVSVLANRIKFQRMDDGEVSWCTLPGQERVWPIRVTEVRYDELNAQLNTRLISE
jgi:hypothetical protein